MRIQWIRWIGIPILPIEHALIEFFAESLSPCIHDNNHWFVCCLIQCARVFLPFTYQSHARTTILNKVPYLTAHCCHCSCSVAAAVAAVVAAAAVQLLLSRLLRLLLQLLRLLLLLLFLLGFAGAASGGVAGNAAAAAASCFKLGSAAACTNSVSVRKCVLAEWSGGVSLCARPRGPMDTASDFESEDCGFESHRGRSTFFFFASFFQMWQISESKNDCTDRTGMQVYCRLFLLVLVVVVDLPVRGTCSSFSTKEYRLVKEDREDTVTA